MRNPFSAYVIGASVKERRHQMMKVTGLAIRILIMIVSFSGTIASAEVLAQSVRVDVSLDTVVSKGAPTVFGFSGNIWWIPQVFAVGVAETILDMKHLGITRISLGDQLLNDAKNVEDLQKRLETYPLNEFLRRYVKNGGEVMFVFDAVPRWISSNKSTRKDGRGHSIFRNSPPENYQQWSGVVETVVQHFNGRLGLDAYYEAWNEPIYMYRGSTEDFLKQYLYTVLGARKADRRARVGGPSVIEGVATAGMTPNTEAEKEHHTALELERRFLYKQFLDYASRTAIPELGLRRLPVDFLSWHSFYVDPTKYYELMVPVIRDALADAGYPPNTPLINSEWNIAAVPPYPEGDLNATEVGAAYAAMTLLAMHEAKVNGQVFQMYVDPEVDGYSGGVFTRTGISRANFNAFRLFSMIAGDQLRTKSTDPWVKSVAYFDGSKVYLLVATLAPTSTMIEGTLKMQSAIENEQFLKSIVKAELVGSLLKGKKLPQPFAGEISKISETGKERLRGALRKSASWKDGLTLEIALSGSRRPRANVTRYLIDSKHSNIYRDLGKAERQLMERQRRKRANAEQKLIARLREMGVSKQSAERFLSVLTNKRPLNEALALISPDRRKAVSKVVQKALIEARNHYMEDLNEIGSWQSARLHEETISWPSSGTFRIDVEPNSVQLFVWAP